MKATEILREMDLKQGTASKSMIQRILRASDEGGTIQAHQMVALFPRQPERHTTCSLELALRWAGCE